MGIHRWDRYVRYYGAAVKTIDYLLDNFCLGCHRGSFQTECPFEDEEGLGVECGIGSALMQCIKYVEDNGYLDDEEQKSKLDEIASLAKKLKDNPLEVIPKEKREETEEGLPTPFLRRNSEFEELDDLVGEYLEEYGYQYSTGSENFVAG